MSSVDQATAAALAGVTTRRLQQLDKAGDGPPRATSGRYPAEELGQWLRQRIASTFGVANDGKAYDYEAERARLTKAQADKTELEARELNGELVRVEEVSMLWAQSAGAMRARLLSLPSKVAPRARAAVSDEEAAALVEIEVLEALQELSDDGVPQSARARRERAAAGVEASSQADGESVGRRAPAVVRGKRGRAGAVED